MRPPSLARAVFGALIVVTSVGLSSLACGPGDPLNPCAGGLGQAEDATTKADPHLMDGLWALERINDAPIPASGYKVKDGEYVKGGTLDFRTRNLHEGSCNDAEKTSGVVFANYVIGDGVGGLKPQKSSSGVYDHWVKAKDITLKAYNQERPGTLSYTSTGSTLTVVGLHPDNSSLKLEFKR